MTKVLVFGKNPAIMSRALEALEADGLSAEGVFSVDAVLSRLARSGDLSLVAIGGGVGPEELRKVHEGAGGVPVADIYGPETLLAAVRAALGR
jgi:hypothetical protein